MQYYLLGEDGNAVCFTAGGTLCVFERCGDEWVMESGFDFDASGCVSMAGLRSYLGSVVQWLGDCKVVAAKLSNGYYRVVLEGYGVGVWAVNGIPQNYIAQIEAFYKNCPERRPSNKTHGTKNKTHRTTSKNRRATSEEREATSAELGTTSEEHEATSEEHEATSAERETTSTEREATSEEQAFIIPIPHKTGFYSADLRDVMAHKTHLNSREILLPFLQSTPFNRLEITCTHVPRWFEKELPYLHLRADIESSQEGVKIHVYRE